MTDSLSQATARRCANHVGSQRTRTPAVYGCNRRTATKVTGGKHTPEGPRTARYWRQLRSAKSEREGPSAYRTPRACSASPTADNPTGPNTSSPSLSPTAPTVLNEPGAQQHPRSAEAPTGKIAVARPYRNGRTQLAVLSPATGPDVEGSTVFNEWAHGRGCSPNEAAIIRQPAGPDDPTSIPPPLASDGGRPRAFRSRLNPYGAGPQLLPAG